MSLDVSLYLRGVQVPRECAGATIFIREGGQTKEISRAEWDERFPDREPVTVDVPHDDSRVFDWNITHNLTQMADAAGLYACCWRPEENGITKAQQMIEPLRAGIKSLVATPERFRAMNPANGWGSYEGLLKFARAYLEACEEYPDADIAAYR